MPMDTPEHENRREEKGKVLSQPNGISPTLPGEASAGTRADPCAGMDHGWFWLRHVTTRARAGMEALRRWWRASTFASSWLPGKWGHPVVGFLAEQQASARAHQLEAIFEAMADGIFVYDKDGHILQMNQAARDLLGLDARPDYTSLSLNERATLITQRYVQGQSLPRAQWATTRVLGGEVLTDATAVDVTTRDLHGHEMYISISGAPVRDQEGHMRLYSD